MILHSCEEDSASRDVGYGFFPLEEGLTWVYQVDSIIYDDFSGTEDTIRAYRKEKIIGIRDTVEESPRYLVNVYEGRDSLNLTYMKTTYVYKTDYRVVREADNKPIMQLVFPIKNRVYWNANQLNNEPEDRYRYWRDGKSEPILKDTYWRTIFVEQANDTTIIDEDIRWEFYADSIGLVEKRHRSLEKQFGKRDGFDYHWTLLSFEKEE